MAEQLKPMKEIEDLTEWFKVLRTAFAEPLLRISRDARVIERSEANEFYKEAFDIGVAANVISDALFEAEDVFFRHVMQLDTGYRKLFAGVEKLITSNDTRQAADDQQISNLKRRVAELEWRLKQRHGEHNPKSPEVRAKVLSLTDGKCAYCGSEISDQQGDGTGTFAVEHVVPKSCGGPDHLTNFVPACSSCNSQKSAGHVLDFIRKRVGGS